MPRIIKISVALIMLVALVMMCWNAPISGDEEVHYRQALNNLKYYKTLGMDKSALDTPISHLRDYGQSFDNMTAAIITVFDIKNVYRFRHTANGVITWLLIVVCGLTIYHLSENWWAAGAGMILLFISPRFLGHGLNNLKDIPFSFGYMLSMFSMLKLLKHFPGIDKKYALLLLIGIAFTISIRIGGLLLICYLFVFVLFRWYEWNIQAREGHAFVWKIGIRYIFFTVGLAAGAYLLGILFWPYGLESPFSNPFSSLKLMHQYPTAVRQIFEGKLFWSEQFPRYYVLKYLLITIPLPVLFGLAMIVPNFGLIISKKRLLDWVFLSIAAGFPVFYVMVSGSNLYGGWRQLLFIYPPLLVLSVTSIFILWKRLPSNGWKVVLLLFLLAGIYHPVRHISRNYPYYYIYFNPLAGGTQGAYGNYEWDYYFTGFGEAYDKLWKKVSEEKQEGQILVASNFIIQWYFDTTSLNIKPVLLDYYERGNKDWDYGIFCNTFIPPQQLKEGYWPPSNTMDIISMDSKPVSVVIMRKQRFDLLSALALREGNYGKALAMGEAALESEPNNESAIINAARAHISLQHFDEANILLDALLDIYPDNEWAYDLKSEIFMAEGDLEASLKLLSLNLEHNYKFYHSYINLSKVHQLMDDPEKAAFWLHRCLWLNPFYKPALIAMGNLLMETGAQEKAKRYFDRASAF